MSIDARIPLMAQTPAPIDPFASLGKVLQIKEYQQQSEARARKLAKEQQFDAIAQQYGDDPEELVKQIYRVDPEVGAKLSKLHAEAQREGFLGRKAKGEAEVQSIEMATRKLQSIADGDVGSLAAWRAEVVSLDPQLNPLIPPPEQLAIPEVKARVSQMGVSTATYQAAENKAMEMFAEGKFREGLGNALAAIPSLEAAKAKLDEARKLLPKAAQSDIAIFEQILASADGLPAFQEAAGNAALGVKQRADLALAQQDNEQQAIRDKETQRHNRATEATAAGNLNVARENLKLRKQELTYSSGGGPVTPEDNEMVKAIMANPAIYAGLTPTAKTKLAVPLAKAGFSGFGADGKAGPDVTKIMDEIETLGKRIFTSNGGPIANITGAFRTAAAKANWDNDVAEYNALVEGMIPMVARANGHTGVLTQQDVDSTRALFGKIGLAGTDNATLAQNKIDRVKRLIKGGGAAKPTDVKVGDVVTVRGQRVKVTRVLPDGKYEGDVVP